jgi:hypothetical protein
MLDGLQDAERRAPALPNDNMGLGEDTVQSNLTVLRENLAVACRERKMTHDPLCAAAVDLHFAGVRALDIYRLATIADNLDVSVDWLLGRSDSMEVPKAKANSRP